MTLDELIPISRFNQNNDLTFRETLAKTLANKIEAYYVFDARCLVIYAPTNDSHKGKGTKNNMIGNPDCIEIEYLSCDFIPLTENIVRDLWGCEEEKLQALIYDSAPEGFFLQTMLDGENRPINESTIYVNPNFKYMASSRGVNEVTSSNVLDKPTNTALKVIGLLMSHLSKSPKYAVGNIPNKTQIKELLLELSEEFDVNEYGLSKVDERLLTDALKYIENQKK